MKTLAEKIAVMQAAERGEQIERCVREDDNGKWESVDTRWIAWDWRNCDYRVAPRTIEIVVVAWRTSPQFAFVLGMNNYKGRHDKEQMLLLSTQTITY